jgi:hypothetical protein
VPRRGVGVARPVPRRRVSVGGGYPSGRSDSVEATPTRKVRCPGGRSLSIKGYLDRGSVFGRGVPRRGVGVAGGYPGAGGEVPRWGVGFGRRYPGAGSEVP